MCVFQSSRIHRSMNVKNTIEKLQRVVREKEMQKNEHRWKHEEEAELLRKKEAKEELK